MEKKIEDFITRESKIVVEYHTFENDALFDDVFYDSEVIRVKFMNC